MSMQRNLGSVTKFIITNFIITEIIRNIVYMYITVFIRNIYYASQNLYVKNFLITKFRHKNLIISHFICNKVYIHPFYTVQVNSQDVFLYSFNSNI